jgi:2-polyprenyl-6-methoxyphenol hydroxylase-like FAD-dependent oxidoreductase
LVDVVAELDRAREYHRRHAWADACDAFRAIEQVAPPWESRSRRCAGPGSCGAIPTCRTTDDPFLCQASRPCLEDHIRARVRARPNVEIIDQCDTVGVTTDAARDRVTGLRVLRRAGEGAEETIHADLVVDATGLGSRTPTWLAALGYDEPHQEQLTIDLLYATRRLRLRPGALSTKVVGIGAQPSRPAGFVLFAQEGDRWILTVFGYAGHHPPRDAVGLLDAVETMAPPDIFAAIRDAEPLGDIAVHRFPANVRRRYDRLRRFPSGYLVFGDAICSTNPAYALGMSVAALQAVALRDALARGDRNLARRFFCAAAKPVNQAWQAVVGGDLTLPQVPGPHPLPVRLTGPYAARVLRAAGRDAVLARQFLRVASLQDPSTRLFRPGSSFASSAAAAAGPSRQPTLRDRSSRIAVDAASVLRIAGLSLTIGVCGHRPPLCLTKSGVLEIRSTIQVFVVIAPEVVSSSLGLGHIRDPGGGDGLTLSPAGV